MSPERISRRAALRGGLGVLAAGTLPWRGWAGGPACPPPHAPAVKLTDPVLELAAMPPSRLIGGFPFHPYWTGDDFQDDAIPFHVGGAPPIQTPTEDLDVAIIGGGLSGLTTAYLLRERGPVLFELRPRFGGNAFGESWTKSTYSLGSAYLITPDKGDFLDTLYTELGLPEVVRESYPPDPVEFNGVIGTDFWSGKGMSPADRFAFERYAAVVRDMAENRYPDIPLPKDKDVQWIRDLDYASFLTDVERQMGVPMPHLLKAAVQSYFYSSFGWGMEEISAAAGWNFVAAEEYGRWVFPGGISYLARALWLKLLALDERVAPECRPFHLRAGCRVADVRKVGDWAWLTYVDAKGGARTVRARKVVFAGSKHIVKHVLQDVATLDPAKTQAFDAIHTSSYLIGNVLLNAPIERDFYDLFLLGDGVSFPVDQGQASKHHRVIDVLNGDFARRRDHPRRVLTLYWPLPFGFATHQLFQAGAFDRFAERLALQMPSILELFKVPASQVQQIRLTRWGHAMPIAHPGLIASGVLEAGRRPIGDLFYFANQDNWALPAVETCLLEAEWVASQIGVKA